MRKHSWIIAGLLAAAMLCSSAFAAEKTFVYNLQVEPKTIDPVLNNAVDGSNMIYNIFEGLFRIGFDDKPEPGLAKSWDISEDGLTWTFHLRDGLKWHDGSALTADHFRYGFLRLINAEVASPYAFLGFCIKNAEKYYKGECTAEEVGIKVIDDVTLQLDLEYRNPLMADHLSYHVFYPAKPEIVDANPRSWTTSPETILCNGPFYLAEWKHNAEITLKKNPYYWDADNVKIDKVRAVMINDANTALAAFRSGRVDFIKNLPTMSKAALIASGEAQTNATLGVSFSVFNVNKAPFDDVRVRKAFALAVDRNMITKKVTMAGEEPASGFIPSKIPGPSTAADFRGAAKVYFSPNAQVEEARKLLAEAGYPDGKGFPTVTYKYNTNENNKLIAEALQAMWKQNLGVNVELYNEEWKVFLNTRHQRNFQIARHGYLVDFFDPGSLLDLWVSDSGENYAGYNNPEYDRLVIAARSEMDNDTRMGYYIDAEDHLLTDMVVLPINFYTTSFMLNSRIKGLYMSPRNWDFFRGIEIVE